MTKNFPLLWKTYEYIEAHPKEWEQHSFAGDGWCGTTMCFAGHAVFLSDANVRLGGRSGHEFMVDEVFIDIEEFASNVLGIASDEADSLFYRMTDDPHDLKEIIETWEAEATASSDA